MIGLKRCPLCGSSSSLKRECDSEYGNHTYVYVECNDCRLSLPCGEFYNHDYTGQQQEKVEKEAVIKWNSRFIAGFGNG